MTNYQLRSFFIYLRKNKLYTFVTIFGFAISLMFVFLLSLYIDHELSVDQFHAKKDRIYRLYREDNCCFAPKVGQELKEQYPEIESYVRIKDMPGNVSFSNGKKVRMHYMLTDSAFFTMFSFHLLKGDEHEVLSAKNKIVLSESFARKAFGNLDIVGKSLTLNDKSFVISGVIEDMPDNTHFEPFDAIVTFDMLAEFWQYPELLTTYNNSSFGLYFLAKAGTDLPSKAPVILEKFNKDYWMYKKGFSKKLAFEPLKDVYFSDSSGPGIKNNSMNTVLSFGVIAIIILVIAIINYINLTVAQTGNRSKEFAIKKLIGSAHWRILLQQISESIALSMISALLALLLAFMAEPFFDQQMNTQLHLKAHLTLSSALLFVGVVIFIGIVSGIIPALVSHKFSALQVVKGSFRYKNKQIYSKVLIAFQYMIAIVLVICTWTIARQSKFMQQYDLGFDKDNLFWMDYTIDKNQEVAFRNEVMAIPGVKQMTYTRGTPIDGGNNESYSYKDKPVSLQTFMGDSAYLSVFGFEVEPVANVSPNEGVYVNEEAIQELGLGEHPTTFYLYEKEYPIIGIIKNFNFRSLHTKVGPALFSRMQKGYNAWSIVVKLDGKNVMETVNRIKKVQADLTGGEPMESGFADDTVNQWYKAEVRRARLVAAFTMLAIIISSMGIFAMSLYYMQQKVKEIGVRKVNGAHISQIMLMLNRDFIKWVVIAFVLAIPVAWLAMDYWLENFAYKITMNWWMFALSGIFIVCMALITISYQSWRAASRNPVESLRYE